MTAKKFKYKGHNPLREMVLETFGEDEDIRDSEKKDKKGKAHKGEKEKSRKKPDDDLPLRKGTTSPEEEGKEHLPSRQEPSDELALSSEGTPGRVFEQAGSGTGEEEKPEAESDGLPTPREIASLIPSSLSIDSLRQWKVLPLQIRDDMLEVGIPSMGHFQNAQILGASMGYPVEVRTIPEEKLMALLRRLYDFRSGVADETVEAMEGIEDLDNLVREDVLSDSVDVPVIRLVNGLILDAIRQRATDIHVEPYEEHVQIRFRIDGVLHDRLQIPRSHQAPVTSRIKVMARMDIAEHMVPQDGRIGVTLGGKAVDIRVSSVPTQHGERIALRVLDKGHGLLSLEDLGMSPREKKIMEDIIHIPHGMILFTGPTGSGKTTTMYAILQALSTPEVNIITVEDPIEYDLPGVAQMQVNEKAGVTFSSALRSILRQDPDILMIGEMRDFDTAHIGVQASLTGHLVLSTLHTNDSIGAVIRLIDMGIEPYLAAGSLIASVAQRLVRRICPNCRQEIETGAVLHSQGISRAFRGKGCDHCNWTGYRGRVGIYEQFVMDDDISEAVAASRSLSVLRQMAREKGFRTLWEIGLEKVLQGVTSPEELLRVTSEE